MPLFTGRRARRDAIVRARRATTTYAASVASVPATQSHTRKRSYRSASRTSVVPNTPRSSSCGKCSDGTVVRHNSPARTTQIAAATAKVAPRTMRVAVISDVHGNRHALEAVLAQIGAESVDAVWCLGDTVGYGPEPNECCQLVRDHADLCLVGNHDLVALGALAMGDFNEEAAAAAVWTREALTDESRAFLRSLEPRATVDGAELFHAS